MIYEWRSFKNPNVLSPAMKSKIQSYWQSLVNACITSAIIKTYFLQIKALSFPKPLHSWRG